jgi:hypothetical protein
MPPSILKDPTAKSRWSVIHPLNAEDSAAVAALRSVVAPMKGKIQGTAGRGPFNGIMEQVAVPEGVAFAAESESSYVAGVDILVDLCAIGGRQHTPPVRLRCAANAATVISDRPLCQQRL